MTTRAKSLKNQAHQCVGLLVGALLCLAACVTQPGRDARPFSPEWADDFDRATARPQEKSSFLFGGEGKPGAFLKTDESGRPVLGVGGLDRLGAEVQGKGMRLRYRIPLGPDPLDHNVEPSTAPAKTENPE